MNGIAQHLSQPIGLDKSLAGWDRFATILALYEFAVRRVNVLRFLFGMKPLPKQDTSPKLADAFTEVKQSSA